MVKTGSEIKNFADIENLVVSLIYRMEESFSVKQLFDLTKQYLDGCEIAYSNFDIEKIIDTKLDLLQRNNYVVCSNGEYKTTSIQKTVISKTNLIFSEEEKLDLGILD